jgi:hypothetical protein
MKKAAQNLKPTSFGKRRNGAAKKAFSKFQQKPKKYRGQGR